MTETQPPAALHPFRGWRFTGALAAAIGPPADIASSEDARTFVEQRPRNAVRLEIADDDADLRFRTARALLSAWERDGTLHRDAAPSLYVYEQEFDDIGRRRSRRGIFGLAPIDVPEVCVLPHEDTWEDNLARRTRLLGDLRASLSPIFLLYNGDGSVAALLDELTARSPDATGDDTFGETHRLWRVSDDEDVARLSAAMHGRHYVIADGHHRFAAAQLHHDEQPSHDTGVILACCVEATDPGIVIRPIHRLLDADAAAWRQALDHLADWFDIDARPVNQASGWALVAALGVDERPTFGLLAPGGEQFVILRLRSWAAIEALLPSDVVEPVRQLDVTVATSLVIERAFGLAHEQQAESVSYTNDPDDALSQVAASQARAGLLLRPPLLEQVMAVARAGGRMPPKSTSFVPKLPIGIVMHDFEPAIDAD